MTAKTPPPIPDANTPQPKHCAVCDSPRLGSGLNPYCIGHYDGSITMKGEKT